jgi:epoxyqueuosine reductase QueG
MAAEKIDVEEVKNACDAYVKKKGALAFGIANVKTLDRIAPEGCGPSSMLPKVKSVISIGVGGGTKGSWAADAKTLAYIGDTETMAYRIAYGLAFFIESKYGYRSIFVPPDMNPEKGARVPMQSLKLHAEVAGIGARSMAGDILLHPEYGMMYYASVFTEMDLPADVPMAENPCPHPSCVTLYRQSGQTPCMRFCPVECLSGSIGDDGQVEEMHYDAHACAEMSQQYEAIPSVLLDTLDAKDPIERGMALHGPENQVIWYKLSIGAGELLSLCYECMRVCPITQTAPMANPVARGAGMRQKIVEAEAAARTEHAIEQEAQKVN